MESPTSNADEWPQIFDELKQKESLTSDAKLAELLGVSRGYICSVRNGRKNVSMELAKKIFILLERPQDVYNCKALFTPIKNLKKRAYNAKLRKLALDRAQGHCQLCHAPAPFKSPDGTPYLEAHHIVPLREGGANTPENVIALCSNCHSKVHVSPDAKDIEKLKALFDK